MESLGILLITANIGSMSDEPGEIERNWCREFYKMVQEYQPAFLALHLQEFGGKNYKTSMAAAENFIRTLMHSEEMSQYDSVWAFIDSDFTKPNSFTALGSVYFIHRSLRSAHIYDFRDRQFVPASGKAAWMGSLEDCPNVHKERFRQDFWPEFNWTRKGFMRTRWLLHDRMFDLVNLHLFHDVSNLVSSECSPSIYSSNRTRALTHVLARLQDGCNVPFFLFGDFNFRLDLKSLIQAQGWSATVTEETGRQTAVYEQNGEVHLVIKSKMFEHQNVDIFQKDGEQTLLRFDQEPLPFLNELAEVQISFPPTYPFSEDVTEPSEFMGTRCPAWCDRVFMSHSARTLLHKATDGDGRVKYGRMAGDVCVGDHKPVFLFFEMESPSEQPGNGQTAGSH